MSNPKMTPAVRRALTHYHVLGRFPKGLHRPTKDAAEMYLTGYTWQPATRVDPEFVAEALNCPLGKACARFLKLGLQPSSLQRGASTIRFVGFTSLGYVVEFSAYSQGGYHATVYRPDLNNLSFYGNTPTKPLPKEIEDCVAFVETEDDQIRAAMAECALSYMKARKAASEEPDSRDILGAYPRVKAVAQGLRITDSEAWGLLYELDQKGLVHLSCASRSDDLYDNECTLRDKAA